VLLTFIGARELWITLRNPAPEVLTIAQYLDRGASQRWVLLRNAYAFGREGGAPWLSTGPDDARARIYVTNSREGPGMHYQYPPVRFDRNGHFVEQNGTFILPERDEDIGHFIDRLEELEKANGQEAAVPILQDVKGMLEKDDRDRAVLRLNEQPRPFWSAVAATLAPLAVVLLSIRFIRRKP